MNGQHYEHYDTARLNAIPITGVARRMGYTLQKAGSVYKTRCPWHDDRHPSLTLYERTNENRCYCFSCGKGGSVIDFVMQSMGFAFKDACEWLSREYGISTTQPWLGNKSFPTPTPRPKLVEPSYTFIPAEMVENMMSADNSLCQCLLQMYDANAVESIVEEYRIGCYAMNGFDDFTVFPSIDATRHGRYLYEHDSNLEYLRHPIRENFRCMSMGYSQGGSVAMACHRFVEQNNLTEELHFVGSACGDGPYDPMATLMYYVKQDLDGKPMSMPVVLPLIVKGMLDTNPYMKLHTAEEYFRPEFLETGIMDWIASKEFSTGAIDDNWRKYASSHPGKMNYVYAKLRDIMNDECYAYFTKIYEDNKNTFTNANGIPLPAHRGVMEDLHLALSSNDMTSGWNPSHPLKLFHSKGDTVVPYVNATRAKNALGSKVELEDAPNGQDHIDSGLDFFRGDDEKMDVGLHRILSTRMLDYVNYLCDKKW